MKRVLYITTVSGTINAFLVPHIKMLLESGYKVDIACNITSPINNELLELGVNIYEIPFSRSPFNKGNIKAFKELIKIQKRNKYDIIHVHTPIASIYGRLLKLRFKNIRTIYTAHGYHFLKGGNRKAWLIYYPIEKIMAKFTDITITMNSEDYEITKKRLKPKKSFLINGVGIDIKKYSPLSDEQNSLKRSELGLNQDDFVVIMIAELNANKNQIQLIKAMELLKNKDPNIKALLVGKGGMLSTLQNELESRDLKDTVKILGFRTDVNELINISNIGTLLSYREGLPRNIMELMANGKQVIATNIRGCKDLVCNENVGKLVEVGDYVETANAIEKYYLTKETKEEVAATVKVEESKQYLKEIEPYNVDNVVKDLKNVFKDLD